MRFFLEKVYNEKPFSDFMAEIGAVHYYKCSNCGFTTSRTHNELSEQDWEKLNYKFHHYLEEEHIKQSERINQPPY
ncbi:MAG: hypothetical protein M3R17_20360, partial [Bacteroidota bacterium]|nr:hypothetical protein [Bacteroidota bacterium]